MVSYFLQIGLNSLIEAMQVSLLAAGFLLIFSVTRVVNLGLGAAFVVGGYGFYSGLQLFGGILEAFLIAASSLFILAVINLWLLRPFVAKGLDLMALLVSVSLWFIIQEMYSLFYGAQGRALVDGVLPTVHVGELVLPVTAVWTLIVTFVLAVFATLIFMRTPLGRSVRALKQHSAASAQLGVREGRLQAGAFLIAILLAGLMGIFTGMNQAITPTYAHPLIVPAFLAFLVGGGKDIRGVVLAALLLVLVPSFIVALSWGGVSVSQTWREVLVFVLGAGLLIVRPDGLLSIKLRTS
ncbi:branched-chain amino acid ABC transporter permease [Candidatus Peregrinibacteria bacterium]|nr:MAG: branched-chain amino acid ABC transporter permease [Candidatus Peregrinibacteria bacterium]